jgi:hypothetical protein
MYQLYPIVRRARRPLNPPVEPFQAVPSAVVEPPPAAATVESKPVVKQPGTRLKRDERELAS